MFPNKPGVRLGFCNKLSPRVILAHKAFSIKTPDNCRTDVDTSGGSWWQRSSIYKMEGGGGGGGFVFKLMFQLKEKKKLSFIRKACVCMSMFGTTSNRTGASDRYSRNNVIPSNIFSNFPADHRESKVVISFLLGSPVYQVLKGFS